MGQSNRFQLHREYTDVELKRELIELDSELQAAKDELAAQVAINEDFEARLAALEA